MIFDCTRCIFSLIRFWHSSKINRKWEFLQIFCFSPLKLSYFFYSLITFFASCRLQNHWKINHSALNALESVWSHILIQKKKIFIFICYLNSVERDLLLTFLLNLRLRIDLPNIFLSFFLILCTYFSNILFFSLHSSVSFTFSVWKTHRKFRTEEKWIYSTIVKK